ncbi:MAG: hypothetical protein QXD32_00805 [Nitrososphaerota archaeon]
MKGLVPPSFEERVLRDHFSLVLLLEISTALAAAFVFSAVLRITFIAVAVLGSAASALLVLTLIRMWQVKSRKLALAEVKALRQVGWGGGLFLPWAPMFSLGWRGYEVEVETRDMGRLRFLDWKPHRVGDKLLLLLDRAGNVLAVNGIRQPIRLELLRKLSS